MDILSVVPMKDNYITINTKDGKSFKGKVVFWNEPVNIQTKIDANITVLYCENKKQFPYEIDGMPNPKLSQEYYIIKENIIIQQENISSWQILVK